MVDVAYPRRLNQTRINPIRVETPLQSRIRMVDQLQRLLSGSTAVIQFGTLDERSIRKHAEQQTRLDCAPAGWEQQ